MASSSLAGTINATTPLWTAVIASSVGVDRLTNPRRVIGLPVGFRGALILLSPWDSTGSGSLLGLLACVGAAMSYGVTYVDQARYITNRGVPPLMLAFARPARPRCSWRLRCPSTGSRLRNSRRPWSSPSRCWASSAPASRTSSDCALITTEGPTAASVVTYLVPAVSVALGVTFLSEPAGPNLLGGVVLILLGVALVQRRRARAVT